MCDVRHREHGRTNVRWLESLNRFSINSLGNEVRIESQLGLSGYNVPVARAQDEFLKFRISQSEKKRFTRLAKAFGLSLSSWIRMRPIEGAERQEQSVRK